MINLNTNKKDIYSVTNTRGETFVGKLEMQRTDPDQPGYGFHASVSCPETGELCAILSDAEIYSVYLLERPMTEEEREEERAFWDEYLSKKREKKLSPYAVDGHFEITGKEPEE